MSSIGSFIPSSSYLSPTSRAEPTRPVAAGSAAPDTAVGQSSTGAGLEKADTAPIVPVAGSAEGQGVGADPREAAARQEVAGKESQLELVEQAEIRQLAARDREVRAHEQAHMAVGGQYAGGVSYDYSRGPDGRLYATGGSVSIDISPVSGDPAATITKMQQVQRAALAPAEPSGQDRAVAAQAAQLIAQARAEIASTSGPESASSATPDSGGQGSEASAEAVSRAEPVPVATGVRELATYRQIDAPVSSASAGFRASA